MNHIRFVTVASALLGALAVAFAADPGTRPAPIPVKDLPEIKESDIIIDAVFGSGLSKPVSQGIAAEVIKHINKSKATVVAIDIPSGLFGEDNSENTGEIIQAKHTRHFSFRNLLFCLQEMKNLLGRGKYCQ